MQEAPKATQLEASHNSYSQDEKFSDDRSEAASKLLFSSSFSFPCILEHTRLCHDQNLISNADMTSRINQSKNLITNKRKGKNKKKMMDFTKLRHHRMNQSEMKLILFAIFYFFCCLANQTHAAENHLFDGKIHKNHPSLNFLTRSKRESLVGGSSEGM